MEQDGNPFWEHPMVPGARDRNQTDRPDPEPEPASDPADENATRDFGVAVSIPKFTAVRRELWDDDDDERPAKPLEPWQQQWSGGWRDFLDAQPEAEVQPYRDEFDDMLRPHAERTRGDRRWHRRAIAVACWGGLVCLLVGFVLLAFDYAAPTPKNHNAPKASARHPASAVAGPPNSGSSASQAASPTPTAAPLLPGPNATPGCVDNVRGDGVTGTGMGATDSGPDAILWFEHSYYVDRSAARARQAVASNAAVSAVDRLQHGIDSVPLGTTYCVHITPGPPQMSDTQPAGARQWRVDITEQRPGEDSYIIEQTISTIASDDGTVLITDIVAVE